MEKFLERLQELKNKDMTYKQLAKEIGIPNSTIYSWSNKSNMPKINNIIKLSNYFKCSIEYLIGRTDDNSELQAKDCLPFSEQLLKILNSKNLKKTPS